MGLFVNLRNVDRVPGLVVRVIGTDTIDINIEPIGHPIPLTVDGSEARKSDASRLPDKPVSAG